jgi:hypothetical protein
MELKPVADIARISIRSKGDFVLQVNWTPEFGSFH